MHRTPEEPADNIMLRTKTNQPLDNTMLCTQTNQYHAMKGRVYKNQTD